MDKLLLFSSCRRIPFICLENCFSLLYKCSRMPIKWPIIRFHQDTRTPLAKPGGNFPGSKRHMALNSRQGFCPHQFREYDKSPKTHFPDVLRHTPRIICRESSIKGGGARRLFAISRPDSECKKFFGFILKNHANRR